MRNVEQLTDVVTFHGEGPVWSLEWGGLRFVDMHAGGVLTLRDDGKVDRITVGKVAAMVRPRAGGGYVVATEKGIALADDLTAAPTREVRLTDRENERMNEGGAAPDGSLYVGSMAWDGSPDGGRLYRVTPDGGTEVVLDPVSISNGLGFSPDHTRAYYADSGPGRIDVFDVDGGVLGERRPLVTFDDDDGGVPDGLVIDSQGALWVAVNGAGQVRRYSPDGELLETVEVPVPGVTACTLGGPGLTDLFVTTSREGDDTPGAGAVYATAVDVPGLPVLPFAG
ncbi:Sugar lactone lactonase YvrE [Georgenia satyanarayanai]|uniref:Sugar lactone lactonase YvrE n=1 Tax=Georgenia satyanarayanai TaxID=860221 RepID=A0A2Y8ZW44_9MICO|nr:SMP-30/gluconolactonase/LRE family protein [Georgenia satyanarayanai]PYG01751.1 sugar lactone lactonase YvrE [Georgenia satyanarayanai]SSA36551.1 Sugar lactone lactonase YvrE [Georgenia satyanarayanai]